MRGKSVTKIGKKALHLFRNVALATVAAGALMSAAGAQTITNRIVSFGDSLTDNGNAFALVGAQPGGPYAADALRTTAFSSSI